MHASLNRQAFVSSLVVLATATTAGATGTMQEWEDTLHHKIASQNDYPAAALRDGVEGTVKIHLKFAGDGDGEGVEIIETSAHKLLGRNALHLALRLKGIPALPNGQENLSLVIPLTFQITDKG